MKPLIFQWLLVKRPRIFTLSFLGVSLLGGLNPHERCDIQLEKSFCNIFTVSLAMNCHGRSFPLHEWPAMSSIPLEYIGIRSINEIPWMFVFSSERRCKKFSNPQTSNVFGIGPGCPHGCNSIPGPSIRLGYPWITGLRASRLVARRNENDKSQDFRNDSTVHFQHRLNAVASLFKSYTLIW